MFSSACTRERGSRVRLTESRHTIASAGACASQRPSRGSASASGASVPAANAIE